MIKKNRKENERKRRRKRTIDLQRFFFERSKWENFAREFLHAETITCLRNSGANCYERRDNAIVACLGGTEASVGAGNENATSVDAAIEPSTRTEHLCRVREAHRVSSTQAERYPLFLGVCSSLFTEDNDHLYGRERSDDERNVRLGGGRFSLLF